MIYTSNKKWEFKKFFIPNYSLKYAYSTNGFDWKTTNKFIIKSKKNEIAITRPWIIKLKNKKILFYSFKNYKNRGRNYNIDLLSSIKKWNRIDKNKN